MAIISFIGSSDDTELYVSSPHFFEMNYDKLQQIIVSHAYYFPSRNTPVSDTF